MFEIGALVVYGNNGVCRVREMTKQAFLPEQGDRLYYVLEPLYQQGQIFAPVDGGAPMRPVIGREEADRLIDGIPAQKPEAFHSPVLRELTAHYSAALHASTCADLLALTMSIYSKKQARARQNQKVGQVDETYMKRAEELLYGELAAALGIAREQVPSYIAGRVRGAGKKAAAGHVQTGAAGV